MSFTGTNRSRRLAAAAAAAALAGCLLAAAPPAGAAARTLGGPSVFPAITPTAWNGTDLVTAQVNTNGNLFAYEQVPGAATWKKEEVDPASPVDGLPFNSPWLAA